MQRAVLASAMMLGTGAASADFNPGFLQGASFDLGYVLEANWIDNNAESNIELPQELIAQPVSSRTELLELGYGLANFSATAALRAVQNTGQPDNNELIIKEFVYNGQLADWEWSLGRRISSFGFGNAFRPLDVIQQQDLITHEQESLVGVNQVLLERYRALDSFGLYLVNPDQDPGSIQAKQAALVARYAASTADVDWQTLLRYSTANRLQTGIGAIRILNDALSLHGSMLWSSRYSRAVNLLTAGDSGVLSATDPWTDVDYTNGVNWMLGGNWTFSQRQSLVLEYWHDDLALSKQQWSEHLALIFEQNQLLSSDAPAEAVAGNLAWSARVFSNTHRVQNNLLFRWSRAGDMLQPRITLLYSVDDAGLMSEAAVDIDRYAIKFVLGARVFSGPETSAYAQLTEKGRIYVTLYGSF